MRRPMSAAQAAQQHNRDGGGRYAARTHAEADVELDVDMDRVVALREVGLRGATDSSVTAAAGYPPELLSKARIEHDGSFSLQVGAAGSRLRLDTSGRLEMTDPDGEPFPDQPTMIAAAGRRCLGALPDEDPAEVMARFGAAASGSTGARAELTARAAMVGDPEYQRRAAELAAVDRPGPGRTETMAHILDAGRREDTDALEQGQRRLEELNRAERARQALAAVASVRRAGQAGARIPAPAPRVREVERKSGHKVQVLEDGRVMLPLGQARPRAGGEVDLSQTVEVTDLVLRQRMAYARDRRIQNEVAHPESIHDLGVDTAALTRQQRVTYAKETAQQVIAENGQRLSRDEFFAMRGVRGKVMEIDPVTGKRRYGLLVNPPAGSQAAPSRQTITHAAYQAFAGVPEATTPLGKARIEMAMAREGVEATMAESGPAHERALQRLAAQQEQMQEMSQISQNAQIEHEQALGRAMTQRRDHARNDRETD